MSCGGERVLDIDEEFEVEFLISTQKTNKQ